MVEAEAHLKVWLIHHRLHLFPRLSFNVLNEICQYTRKLLYPCIYNTSVRVYDLDTGQFTEKRLNRPLLNEWNFCIIDSNRVFGVAGKHVITVKLTNAAINPLPKLRTEREKPGLICLGGFVYLFGGTALSSCEKHSIKSRKWSPLPSMSTPRAYFTPCRVLIEVYLSSSQPLQPFEAFHTVSEEFRELPMRFSQSMFSSITFESEGTVYSVRYSTVMKWEGGAETWEVKKINRGGKGCTNSVPFKAGNKVFWTSYDTGGLVIFDLQRDDFS